MMEEKIEVIRKVRLYLLDKIKELTTEQLNNIPDGFSNNIAWNLGHLVAAQQGVCYARAGLPVAVDNDFFDAYKPGSKPVAVISAEEIEIIKAKLFDTLPVFLADHNKGLFDNYPLWTTRYQVELGTIEEAVSFIYYHDGYHAGIIFALAKIV
jgi:hypothetical protein